MEVVGVLKAPPPESAAKSPGTRARAPPLQRTQRFDYAERELAHGYLELNAPRGEQRSINDDPTIFGSSYGQKIRSCVPPAVGERTTRPFFHCVCVCVSQVPCTSTRSRPRSRQMHSI